MPVVYPQYGPGFPQNGPSPALDGLRSVTTASPQHGQGPNPYRLTENDLWGVERPESLTKEGYPPPATASGEVSGLQQILQSLRMAAPATAVAKGPLAGQPSVMTRLQGPTSIQSSLPGART